MKILFISYNLGRTASGIVSERVLRGLIEGGNDVRVITAENAALDIECEINELSSFLKQGSVLYRLWYYRFLPLFMVDIFNGNVFWRWKALRCADKILRNWIPDCIYCRTSPIDPCFVGLKLKSRFSIPLVVNLTDPLPAPLEYVPEGRLREKLISDAKTIINGSDAILMGTKQAIDYECRVSEQPSQEKFAVSPDPVPTDFVVELSPQTSVSINLLYLGSIYGSRNINKLIAVIEKMRIEGIEVTLTICSEANKSSIQKDFIHYSGWVPDVIPMLSDADILIDIDGDDMYPLFVSSKLKQYLCVDRPILCITPKNSPASEMLMGMNTVTTCVNDFDAIYGSLKNIINSKCRMDYNEDRRDLLQILSTKHVVNNLMRLINKLK